MSTIHKHKRNHYSISSFSGNTSWKKLLWLKQPYSDNYTDKSFLSQLKRNSTVVKYSYTKLMSDFSLVALHLSLIMSVILVFYGTYKLNWNPLKPTLISTLISFIGFIYYVVTLKIRRNKELIELQQLKIKQLTTPSILKIKINDELDNLNLPCDEERESAISSDTKESEDDDDDDDDNDEDEDLLNLEDYLTEPSPPDFYETFKSSILIILYLLILSPVLKSLTNSTSSDSIWALSGWLCLLNVMFNDFQIDFPKLSKTEKELHWTKILSYNSKMNSNSNNLNSNLNLNLSNISSLNSSCSSINEQFNYELSKMNNVNNSNSNINININNNNSNTNIDTTTTNNPGIKNDDQLNKIPDFYIAQLRKSNFSKNIAVSNAIVLASRLQSNASAFSFILFCIQICGLFPVFNNFTRRCGNFGFHLIQLVFVVNFVNLAIWYIFGPVWALLWLLLNSIIIFLGPWYFLTLQKYKDELQGPWDPAKPIVKSL